jgi:hypothetical protein
MSDALAISRGFAIPNFMETLKCVGEQFAFLCAPSKQSAKQLSISSEEMIKNICTILDRIVVNAIEKQTNNEFVAYRDAEFPTYLKAMRAFADYASLTIPKEVLDQLANNSFSEMEENLSEHGDAFGLAVRDQAIFTVWTFKKIRVLIKKILDNQNVLEEHKNADNELAAKFGTYILWARFHLDCLTASLRTHKPIYPGVRDTIADGLRAAVNAYAYVKQGVDLRVPVNEPKVGAVEWDQEDQELLDSSMRDIGRETIE